VELPSTEATPLKSEEAPAQSSMQGDDDEDDTLSYFSKLAEDE